MSAAPQLVPQARATGTVLAFDFGTRRIGVAIGEILLGQARALTTIA
ncbi:MAG TPA: Holliday junction resolvase RuvX, partial [Rhodocyclaceae bacterium]|nr:Holliday junction resolvase RuvX [Rhodocyclaceae bacterium]